MLLGAQCPEIRRWLYNQRGCTAVQLQLHAEAGTHFTLHVFLVPAADLPR